MPTDKPPPCPQCTPITQAELAEMATNISKTNYKRGLDMIAKFGPEQMADLVARAAAHIDHSRLARKEVSDGAAEASLDSARKVLLELLGIS